MEVSFREQVPFAHCSLALPKPPAGPSVTSFLSISASASSPLGCLMGNQAFLGLRAWPRFPFPPDVQVPRFLEWMAGVEPGLLTALQHCSHSQGRILRREWCPQGCAQSSGARMGQKGRLAGQCHHETSPQSFLNQGERNRVGIQKVPSPLPSKLELPSSPPHAGISLPSSFLRAEASRLQR